MPSNSEKLASITISGDMPARPLGFYVLIELVEVEKVTKSGIILADVTVNKEQLGEEAGYLRAVGPTAYHGWEGCKEEAGFNEDNKFEHRLPYQKWGLEIGDMVEFRAYEGKKCVIPGYERWRYIPDSHIVGVVNQVRAIPKSEGGLIRDGEEYQ